MVKNRRLLTFGQLKDYGYRYSYTHIVRLEKAGLFPRRVKLIPGRKYGRVAWHEDEVIALGRKRDE